VRVSLGFMSETGIKFSALLRTRCDSWLDVYKDIAFQDVSCFFLVINKPSLHPLI